MKVSRDYQGLTNMSEDIDTRLSEDQKAAARRLVCGNATDTADAEELMMLLGIHPAQVDEVSYLASVPRINAPGGAILHPTLT